MNVPEGLPIIARQFYWRVCKGRKVQVPEARLNAHSERRLFSGVPPGLRIRSFYGRISIGVPSTTSVHISSISESVTAMHPSVQSTSR